MDVVWSSVFDEFVLMFQSKNRFSYPLYLLFVHHFGDSIWLLCSNKTSGLFGYQEKMSLSLVPSPISHRP